MILDYDRSLSEAVRQARPSKTDMVVAGEVLQKFVTYRKRVVILGDISARLNESSSLRDFVYECNTRREIWFVKSLDELDQKLAQAGQS